MPGPDPEVREGASAAHRRLVTSVADLDDSVARQPSLLPGWSVGHVLTHLARNADSHVRALEAAARGEVVDRYPGGVAQRNREIETGSGRPAAALVADVQSSIVVLEAAWSAMGASAWEQPGRRLGRDEAVASLVFARWREVEVHHADLGLGFSWDDWSAGYVRRDLANATMVWRARQPVGLTGLPPVALALPPARRLAWLLGRLPVEGLVPVPPWL